MTRLAKACAEYGTPEGWTPLEALYSTICSSDIYSRDPCTVRPFNRGKLKVLKKGIEPLPLRPRLPVDAKQNLDCLWSCILCPEAEVEVMIDNGSIFRVTP